MTAFYGSNLNYGGAMIDYCRDALKLWEDGMDAGQLLEAVLTKGADPNRTARTLEHFIRELFRSRYLTKEALPWTRVLRAHLESFPNGLFEQCCYFLTAKSERLLYDFVTEEYWPRVRRGETSFGNQGLYKAFLVQMMQEGRGGGGTSWTEARMKRLVVSLSGVCSGFHLVNSKAKYALTPPVIETVLAVLLALSLKEQGLSAEAVLAHPDWRLFGLYGRGEVARLLVQESFARAFELRPEEGAVEFLWHAQTMMEGADLYVA